MGLRMQEEMSSAVEGICKSNGNESSRMMDIVRAVQQKFGCVSDEAIDVIAREVSVPRAEVESTVSFYAFLSKKPKGEACLAKLMK